MSQAGRYYPGLTLPVETLTGNIGGAITTDAVGNIDILGAGIVTVTGTLASNLLTISVPDPIPVPNGGTGVATLTDHGLMLGSGVGTVTSLAEASDGQLPIGSTGNDPVLGILASASGTIVVTNGAGTIDLATAGIVAVSFDGDAGTATPALGVLTVAGGNNITTGAAGSTVTINVSGTTQYALQVGNATGSLDSLIVGTANQVMQSSGAGVDPTWSTATYPSTTVQGDVLYSSANDVLSSLAKDATATRYLANTGVTNNPAWDQIELTNGVSGILPVPNGGTGVSTLTDHGLMLGSGVGAVTSLAEAADGQLPIGDTGGDPILATITAGNNIGVTNAAGSITIDVNGTTQYAVQLGDATNSLDSLGLGTATQVLQSGGAGANPAWSTATYPATTAQGDVLYSSAANVVAGLAKDVTATRYLANTGATNNPAWDQIELTNGVSGILPVPNGGTGVATLTDHGLMLGSGVGAVTSLAEASNGQIPIGSTGNDPVLGAITSTADTLAVTNGAGTINIEASTGLLITSGFESWGGAGNYYDDTTLGQFDVLRPGTGYVKGVPVSWTATQQVTGMTAGNTYYIYMDDTGTIAKTTTYNETLFENNIVLFECMRDSTAGTNIQVTVKENHPYQYPWKTSVWAHCTIGSVIASTTGGANITLNGTQKIEISGADELEDHGLSTDIPDSGGTAEVFEQYFTLGSGKWARYTQSDTFDGTWDNAGTATALGANKYAVYRLYVSKDDITVATPVYFAVLGDVQYNNLTAANTAIANDTIPTATGELAALEMAQLGYIVFEESSTTIVEVLIAKETARSSFSGITATTAALVLTDTTNFDGILSVADTTVQSSLETIDDWGKAATNHGVLIGQGVNTPIVAQVLTDGQLIIGSTGVDPVGASLTAGANITITPAAGSITIASTASGGITWSIITADLDPMVVDNGYICNKAGLLTMTLPATAAVGTVQRVTGMNIDLGWKIAQRANQIIHFGDTDTTTGAGGSLASVLKRDSVELVCVVEDLEWNVISSLGNITIV